jgi:hypothetical protein
MFIPNRVYKLVDNWAQDVDIEHLLGRMYDTSKILKTVIPEGTFLNYSLKMNKEKLNDVIHGTIETEQSV